MTTIRFFLPCMAWLFLMSFSHLHSSSPEEPLKLGLIGLDTSHCAAFAKILHDENDPLHVPGARIVAGYPGGSPDIPGSWERLPRYTQELQEKWGVRIVDSIPELLELVDAVLLTSVDGRKHLEQVAPVFRAGKRVFIDKPLAADLEESRQIVALSRKYSVPFFSASSLRFFPGIAKFRAGGGGERVLYADAYSPAPLEEHHSDLYWYGIHGVETLYTVMGPGCEKVTRHNSEGGEVVVGVWKDGRIGTFRGLREGPHGYGVRVVTESRIDQSDPIDGSLYQGLVKEILHFFKSGVPPVSPEETLEIMEFMTAAQRSSQLNRPVLLDEVRMNH